MLLKLLINQHKMESVLLICFLFALVAGQTLSTRQAQWNLAGLAYLRYGDIDGLSGPLTTGAVAEFQRDRCLDIDGIVGPITSGELISMMKHVQRVVGAGADGLNGDGTRSNIMAWERGIGLRADGRAGRYTMRRMKITRAKACPTPTPSGKCIRSDIRRYSTNSAGVELIKAFEGVDTCPHLDPIGLWTIGYGHLCDGGDKGASECPGGGECLSDAQVEDLLRTDLVTFEDGVKRNIKVALTENEFAALISFTYNLGTAGGLGPDSSVRAFTNDRRFRHVPGRMALFNKAGGNVLAGLVRRRKAEGDLFSTC